MSVSIQVAVIDRKGETKVLDSLRPVHIVGRRLAVTYKGRLYPISSDGTIDLAKHEPFPENAKARIASPRDLGPLAAKAPKSKVASTVEQKRPWPEIEAPVLKVPSAADCLSKTDENDLAQRHVIDADPSSRILVTAGPGTGKTQVAALRLSHLVSSGVGPGQILVLSFSRSAVRTLTHRIETIAGESNEVIEELRHVAIRTFDSWAFRILRMSGENPHELLRRSHDQNIEALVSLIEGPRRKDVRRLLGKRRHIIVDEFQDLPGVRGRLVLVLLNLLAPPGSDGAGFTVLGDPAQAIYGFAARSNASEAADEDYWRKVQKQYGAELELVTLTKNHRASREIAEFSNELRAVLESSLPAETKLDCIRRAISKLPASGVKLDLSWRGELARSAAILTLTNGEAIRVLQELHGSDDASRLAISLIGKAGGYSVPAPAWIAALLSNLRTSSVPMSQFTKIHQHIENLLGPSTCKGICLPGVEVAWTRLTRAAGGGPDDSSLDIAAMRTRLDWPDSFPDDQQPRPDDHILITTVHQSKGMEFDAVALMDTRELRDDAVSSERAERARVGFVGVTRAARTLARIPGDHIHRPPSPRKFRDGTTRLCFSGNGWINLEIGMLEDVDPIGFVDPRVHGSTSAVNSLQLLLLNGLRDLRGRKVMLVKVRSLYNPNQVVYNIHLQDGKKPAMLLGCTSLGLTRHLLEVVWKGGYALPSTILNLRIADIGTMTAGEEDGIKLDEPYASSRLWLGVGLFGTGDFKLRKRASEG